MHRWYMLLKHCSKSAGARTRGDCFLTPYHRKQTHTGVQFEPQGLYSRLGFIVSKVVCGMGISIQDGAFFIFHKRN